MDRKAHEISQERKAGEDCNRGETKYGTRQEKNLQDYVYRTEFTEFTGQKYSDSSDQWPRAEKKQTVDKAQKREKERETLEARGFNPGCGSLFFLWRRKNAHVSRFHCTLKGPQMVKINP